MGCPAVEELGLEENARACVCVVHVCVTAREGRRSTHHRILPLKGCKDRRKTRPGALEKRKSWLNKERVKKASSQFSGLAVKGKPHPH